MGDYLPLLVSNVYLVLQGIHMYIIPRIRAIHLFSLKDCISQPPNAPNLHASHTMGHMYVSISLTCLVYTLATMATYVETQGNSPSIHLGQNHCLPCAR